MENRVSCPLCARKFQSERARAQHVETYHNAEDYDVSYETDSWTTLDNQIEAFVRFDVDCENPTVTITDSEIVIEWEGATRRVARPDALDDPSQLMVDAQAGIVRMTVLTGGD